VDRGPWEVLGGWLVVEDPAGGEGGPGNRGGGARSWRLAIVGWRGGTAGEASANSSSLHSTYTAKTYIM